MTPSEVLRAARAKIEDERCWTKGASARDADGYPLSPYAPDAVCFCAFGAVLNALDDRCVVAADAAPFIRFLRLETVGPVSFFNDTHTHADVLALFDRAIAAAERAERGEPGA